MVTLGEIPQTDRKSQIEQYRRNYATATRTQFEPNDLSFLEQLTFAGGTVRTKVGGHLFIVDDTSVKNLLEHSARIAITPVNILKGRKTIDEVARSRAFPIQGTTLYLKTESDFLTRNGIKPLITLCPPLGIDTNNTYFEVHFVPRSNSEVKLPIKKLPIKTFVLNGILSGRTNVEVRDEVTIRYSMDHPDHSTSALLKAA